MTSGGPGAPALEPRHPQVVRLGPRQRRRLDLAVAAGTIHGIIGENGAGKSTLMSIVYGYYQADGGRDQGERRPEAGRIRGPPDAIAATASAWSTSTSCWWTPFTVLENVMLGAEKRLPAAPTLGEARAQELERLEREYGLEVDPDAIVGSCRWACSSGSRS